jgi:uncharacterized protein YndB with AHSA1/START domain
MSVRNVKQFGTNASSTVVIERVFAAPRALVFEAWTRPEFLLAWFAPRGCTIRFETIDVRVGGTFHSCIHNPQFGQPLGECWCVGVYHEIVVPKRLVYSIAIADREGRRIPSAQAGHHADWPEETTVDVTFEETRGGTKLTLRQNVSASLAQQTGALPSWLQMLDGLEEFLSARRAANG